MTTIDQQEIEKFSKMADEWWDEKGKFAGVQDDDIIWALVNSSEFKFNK